ncbi:hypothetical protein GCM10018980_68510 [Streptomyces capoamus]|uniref:Uncharacterized protein n=1 Tax=Streptomyces capoamus TaxID=68183 RepID=A0A919F2E7_9ACTN|nr:hypothetical protein GCM10010501_74880 [Streptomyces libani subsp. rufus]GHG72602.1 hypothetical protein GCM10018980_68510 [Streptomyces capoamus]
MPPTAPRPVQKVSDIAESLTATVPARTMIAVTSRRTLGTGPAAPAPGIRASQADLLDALPGFHLPDLGDLRARGVLGAHSAASPSPRRALGAGCTDDAVPDSSA